MTFRQPFTFVALVSLLAACAPSQGAGPDARTESGAEAGASDDTIEPSTDDADVDALAPRDEPTEREDSTPALDGNDAAPDAQPDVQPDESLDARPDVLVDAQADGLTDARTLDVPTDVRVDTPAPPDAPTDARPDVRLTDALADGSLEAAVDASLSCPAGFLPSGGVCKPRCTSALECTATNETCDRTAGVCACRPGTHSCGGACSSDALPTSCGARCTPCPTTANGTASCVDGACVLACNAGAMRCGDACALCPSGTGIATTRCEAAECVIATCASGFTLTEGRCVATPAGWRRAVVDATRVGRPVALALDAAGNPRIAYATSTTLTDGKTRYAFFDGVGWNLEDAANVRPASLSLALDASQAPHIAFLTVGVTASGLHTTRSGAGTWAASSFTQDADDPIFRTPIVIDALGRANVAYVDSRSRALRHAVRTGSTWTLRTIISNDRSAPALGVDSMRRVRAAFSRATPFDVGYATFDGTTWTPQVLAAAPTYANDPALAFDPSDQPHVAYIAGSELVYATRSGASGWTLRTADTNVDGRYDFSLAVDRAGRPHLVYVEEPHADLKYAYFDGAAWRITTLVSSVSGGSITSTGVSIAVDAMNRPRVAYTAGAALTYLWFEP